MPSPSVLLSLDTSGAVGAALAVDGAVVSWRSRYDPRRHTELLLPFVDEVLQESGRTRGDVEAVAVGTGPGPFTGLRVGLVTARVLALALGVPVFGVPSLDALASDVGARGLVPDGATFGVATDARRREVYWGTYRFDESGPDGGRAQRLSDAAVGPAVDAAPAAPTWFGRGAQLYPDAFGTVAEGPLDVSAASLAVVARYRMASGAAGPDEPLYLRRPDAVEPGARKKVTT